MTAAGRIPFALPDIGDEEIAAVVDALRSGWISSGPRVPQFEAAFSQYLSPGLHAVSVNSATAGLHLSLEALGIGPGDEVLVPTWTFTATAEVVRYLGATPVLVDVEPGTLNIDYEAAAQALTDRTRAVIPVHFAGLPVDAARTALFADTHSLHVVEDAAHAFPALDHGEYIGSGGSAATVFSFYATKTLTTGEGGMVVTRDESLAARMRVMRLHGISRDAYDRYRSDKASWAYEVVAPGYKYNLSDPAAAMGLVQLRRSAAMQAHRAGLAGYYNRGLAELPLDLPPMPDPAVQHAWHLYVIRLAAAVDRDAFIDGMAALGVGCSVHFIPLHLQPYWRDQGSHSPTDFPVALSEFGRVVSLPLYSGLTFAQAGRVLDAVRKTLRRLT